MLCYYLIMAKKLHIVDDISLMDEWDYEANQTLDPKKLTRASNKKVSWICSKCRHRWEAKISNRAVLGRGCPVCANKVVVEGVNDLGTTHPQLANEWHPTKNGDLTPKKFTYGSGKKVWWLCPLGHEYKATILHRSSGTNCPVVIQEGRHHLQNRQHFFMSKNYTLML